MKNWIHDKAKKIERDFDGLYNHSSARRRLLDFTVGIIALMIGNLSAVVMFYALSKVKFLIFSFVTMGTLCFNMIWARKHQGVEQYHYFIAFLITYFYGVIMFSYGDNSKGVIMFGLVYPVLSIYVMKSFWGNILIAAELITSLLAENLVNPLNVNDGTRSIYITIYLMFWAFSNIMEQTKEYMERKMVEQKNQLSIIANYDQLTSLYNRRRFYEKVKEQYGHEQLVNSVAIIMMDLDDFKQINDAYGHNIGDEVLMEAARRIQAGSSEWDINCRWGGEEFLLLWQVDSSFEAGKRAQKLCDDIGKELFSTSQGKELFITASFGCFYIDHFFEERLTEYIHQTDQYLYEAKRTGKNKVYAGQQHYHWEM